MEREQETLELRLARGYRHGAVYFLLAALLATPAIVRGCCRLLAIPYTYELLIPFYVGVVVLACLLLWRVHHWRMGIDSYGVHRRVLFLWRHWAWSLFEEGQVRRGATYYAFKVIGKYSRGNTIDFGQADEQAARQALDLCYAHWVRPPRPVLPDRLNFKAGIKSARVWWQYVPRMSTIGFSPQGVWINQRKGAPTRSWNDVTHVVILRPSRDHEKCTAIMFNAGGYPFMLEFPERNESGIFSAPSDLISSYLETYTPHDRILICTEDPPASLAELEERLSFARRKLQEKGFGGAILTIILGLVNLGTVRPGGVGLMNVLTITANFVPIFQVLHARIKYGKQHKELLAQREQFQAEDRSGAPAASV